MALPKIFNWIAADTAAIALTQTLAGAGSLSLNGDLSINQSPVSPLNYILLYPMVRVVTLTSANNLAGVQFTITGSANGHPANEVLVGPNANTVSSVNAYDSITSITTNGAAAAVSAGIGQTGFTSWFAHDYEKLVFNLGIQAVITGNITYSFQVTLDNVNTVFAPTVFTPIVAMTNANANQLANFTIPSSYSRMAITASVGAATLTETIIQQSIR
jgi:hypothetical protein